MAATGCCASGCLILAIEFVSMREQRNKFAYIFSHELGLYMGRVVGCGLFILLAKYFTQDTPMRFALPLIAIIQFISVLVAKSILNDRAWHEPAQQEQTVAITALKEPIEL